LSNDYAFVAAGNSDPSLTWEITGLDPGGLYEMMVYSGVGRPALITADTNGDGDLGDETTVFAPAALGILIENITADATGTITGNFLSNNGGEANWSGFQLRNITVIPEPATGALFVLGASMFWAGRRRRL
jgi:hypothetical protein